MSEYSLQDNLGYLVNRLALTMRNAFERELAAYDVTVAQWAILLTMYRDQARTPRELARVIGIDASAVTKLLDRLEHKGFVARRPHQEDRRSIEVEMTDEARRLMPKLISVSKKTNQVFSSALSAKEATMFKAAVQKMLSRAESI